MNETFLITRKPAPKAKSMSAHETHHYRIEVANFETPFLLGKQRARIGMGIGWRRSWELFQKGERPVAFISNDFTVTPFAGPSGEMLLTEEEITKLNEIVGEMRLEELEQELLG
jgi:hypothetical protein